MEEVSVAGVASDQNEAKITVRGVPDRPGLAAQLFGADRRGEHRRRHDHPERQRRRHDRPDLHRAARRLRQGAASWSRQSRATIGARERRAATRRRQGVDRRPRHAHATPASRRACSTCSRGEGINIQMISTSEIKISVVIDAKYAELAVRALHDAFISARLRRRRRCDASSSTTRRCATAARRRTSASRSRTSCASPSGSTTSASTTSRAAGRARIRATRSSSARSRSSGSASTRDRRLRLDAARRRRGPPTTATCETLLRAETPVVTIVGKTWDLHVREDLRIPLEENLEVIRDSVALSCKRRVDEVIFDAEHFFDGWPRNPEYALACVARRRRGGRRRCVCLCDTSGGALPAQVAAAVDAVRAARARPPLGIHCHNDASSRSPTRSPRVEHGACRCRARSTASASAAATPTWCSIIADPAAEARLRRASRARAAARSSRERLALRLRARQPRAEQAPGLRRTERLRAQGRACTSRRCRRTPRPTSTSIPALVGNAQRVLVSDLSGRCNIARTRRREFGIDLEGDRPAVQRAAARS